MSEKREHIGTTRFNAETWKENIEWREKNGWRGCIYGFPSSMPSSIARGDIVYVIEMNNDTNKIMGIGKINKRHKRGDKIYRDGNYNRYIYKSEYRKDISEIGDDEMITYLEKKLFKGKSHMKRGQGITRLRKKKIKNMEKVLMFMRGLL